MSLGYRLNFDCDKDFYGTLAQLMERHGKKDFAGVIKLAVNLLVEVDKLSNRKKNHLPKSTTPIKLGLVSREILRLVEKRTEEDEKIEE